MATTKTTKASPKAAPAKAQRRPANRAAKSLHRVEGNRSALVGPGGGMVTEFIQAASDHPQMPRLASPSPIGITGANPRLRAMSRYLRTNDAWVRGLGDRAVERIVDTGPKLVWGDPALDDLWTRCAPLLDSRGVHGWSALLAEAVRTWIVDGEAFLRAVVPKQTGVDAQGLPLYGADSSPIPLKLRTMTPEWVPEYEVGYGGETAQCVQGVILDPDDPDVRTGYWVYDSYPYMSAPVTVKGFTATQVPADQIAHLFQPPMPGSYRGENLLTPVLIRALRLADYEDAVVRRKQLDCALGHFLIQDPATAGDAVLPGEYDAVTGGAVGDEGGIDYESVKTNFDVSPGSVNVLPPGMKIETHDPAGTPGGEDWWAGHQLTAYGAVLGMALHEVAPDIKDVSDRAMKFVQAKSKPVVEGKRGVVHHQMLRPLARWFVNACLMSGRWAPAKGKSVVDYYQPTVKWPILRDALMAQDLAALTEAMKAKIVDRDWITESFLGLDPEVVAKSLVDIAARDRLSGFGVEAMELVPQGTAVVPEWDPSTPYAQEVLAAVAAAMGIDATVADAVPPPANPLPLPAASDPNPDPKAAGSDDVKSGAGAVIPGSAT